MADTPGARPDRSDDVQLVAIGGAVVIPVVAAGLLVRRSGPGSASRSWLAALLLASAGFYLNWEARAADGRPEAEVVSALLLVTTAYAAARFRASVVVPAPQLRRIGLAALLVASTTAVWSGILGPMPMVPYSRGALALGATALSLWSAPFIEGAWTLEQTALGTDVRVQRLRLRAISAGLAITVLGMWLRYVGWYLQADAASNAGHVATAVAATALALGMLAPRWLRAAVRDSDLAVRACQRLLAEPLADERALGAIAVRHAVALTGAHHARLMLDGEVLATSDVSDPPAAGDASQPRDRRRRATGDGPLTIVVSVPSELGDVSLELVAEPFLPVFGDDELAQLRTYGLVLGTALDRVRDRAQLLAERDRYAHLLSALDDLDTGVVRLEDHRIVFTNAAARRLTGRRVAGLTRGVDVREVLDDADLRLYRDDLAELRVDAVPPVYLLHELHRDDGTSIDLLLGIALEDDGTGVVIFRDVSEAAAARREVTQREAELRAAQSIAQVGSWTWSPTTGALRWSDELYRILGRDPRRFEPSYDAYLQHIHPDDRRPALQLIQEAIRSGRSWMVRYRVVRSDGEIRRIESRGTAVREANGAVAELKGTCRDVTTDEWRDTTLRRQRAELRYLLQRLAISQERERRRLALELHDEIGQLLTGLQLLVDAPAEHRDERGRASALVRDLQARVRSMALELRPSMLDDLGLGETLRWFVDEAARTMGLEVSLDLEGLGARRLHTEVETTAFRIVQEALTNVSRHAGVDCAEVSVTLRADRVRLRVRDEGRGFDPDQLGSAGTGVSGIRERATAVGGLISIRSEPGQGTEIDALLPAQVVPELIEQDVRHLAEAADGAEGG